MPPAEVQCLGDEVHLDPTVLPLLQKLLDEAERVGRFQTPQFLE
ncbi:MAG: hypothetical protein ACUVV3_01665 [Dehalococcoidia bacterium]